MEARYGAPPSKFPSLGEGTRAHYRSCGPQGAPVLILLHGFSGSLFGFEACRAICRTASALSRSAFRAAIACAKLAVVPGAGHTPMSDRPRGTAAIARAFLTATLR